MNKWNRKDTEQIENTTNIIDNETTNEIKKDTEQAEDTTNIIDNETTNEVKDDTKQVEITTYHINNETAIILPNTTTPDSEKNGSVLTTIPQIMNNTTYISTTIKKIMSTINEIVKTIPETKNIKETQVVLLGFSQFKRITCYFTFYLYLTAIKNILYTKFILFPMIITHNRNIRRLLKETKANCTLDLIESDTKYKYYCLVEEDTTNIKEIKLIPDFDFGSQDNVTLTGITPLAKMLMNNMTVLTEDNIYNNILENSFVYIMDNSKFIKYDKFLFNVTGEIEDPQPKLDNKNLILMLSVENNETPEIQVQRNISNITRNNYILNCKANETFQGEI